MTVIDIHDEAAVVALAESWEVSVDTLRSAIEVVGPYEFDVRNHLRNCAQAAPNAAMQPLPDSGRMPATSDIAWKPIATAPSDGQRVFVCVNSSAGEAFIAIGALSDGRWRLEMDSQPARGAIVTVALWTELPRTLPELPQG